MKLQTQLELQRISLGLNNALFATIGMPQKMRHARLHTVSYNIWRYF